MPALRQVLQRRFKRAFLAQHGVFATFAAAYVLDRPGMRLIAIEIRKPLP
jgi:hypothetical protein